MDLVLLLRSAFEVFNREGLTATNVWLCYDKQSVGDDVPAQQVIYNIVSVLKQVVEKNEEIARITYLATYWLRAIDLSRSDWQMSLGLFLERVVCSEEFDAEMLKVEGSPIRLREFKKFICGYM